MRTWNFKPAADLRSRREALAVAGLVWVATVLVGYLTPFGRELEERLALPASFGVRHALGRSPALSERIRLYALDDATIQYLKREELTLKEWLQVLESFVPSRPKAVVFDRVFANPLGIEESDTFVTGVKALPFPVYAGAFSSPVALGGRKPLDSDRPEFDLGVSPTGGGIESWDWLPVRAGIAYGPNAAILDAFRGVGHLNHEGSYFTPWIRFGERSALSHLALLPTGGDPGRVRQALVDFTVPSRFYERTAPLKPILQGRAPEMPEGSVVVILTAMHTGGTTFFESPLGSLPDGYRVVSILNSALSKQWLAPVPFPALTWFTAAAAGSAVGLVMHTLSFWTLFLGGALACVGLGFSTFAFLGLVFPWLPALAAFGTAGLGTFWLGCRRREAEWDLLRGCLEGALPSEELRQWLGRGERLLKPSGQVLTILFLDIVGFSRAAERQNPEEAFAHLRELMGWITQIVHEHGGLVEKTLGDGLLCFFGLSGDDKTVRHADRAVRCAVQLQRESARRMMEQSKLGKPVFPLRIGINTAGVFLGNLGRGRRIDLNVIGQGVNLARRYEEACETGRLLIGRSTSDLIPGELGEGVSRIDRWIAIKHVAELQKVIEVDPFAGNPQLHSDAVAAHRRFLGVERVDERWTLPAGTTVSVHSPLGEGVLMNFSLSGLCIRFSRFLGKSSLVTVRVADMELVCEVRWGTALKNPQGAYLLGLEIKNLTAEQRKVWVNQLREHVGRLAA